MEAVEVFKTTVNTPAQAQVLEAQLQRLLPACRITFDLEDCDNILRVAGSGICSSQVAACVIGAGYNCVRLE
ncbi:hypothetical protein J0X19_14705 [Hymenobacter sp. BT186]|uniref:Uncharacterized protein n=1 Tax=Hymenobacter telluris TaxID=2816474 RepID=A0A939EXV7_9BACT|nr:hypothetical protein [Hymenobacter telluris]MBO0359209.1 hypothetical protein [Hymenobacter telluris]MBW3375235.1 hypothetical protein [Hymenobacter norwichensis]